MGAFSIRNKTSHTLRGLPFAKIKERVLGKKYELSLAVVGLAESRRITQKYKHPRRKVGVETKKKNRPSNVLSFPLSKTSGEIVLCPRAAGEFTLGYLFIHGCLHLKGFKHSATMDATEARLLEAFNICKKLSQA